MALVDYSPGALADIERLVDFLLTDEPEAAEKTTALIGQAVDVLKQHPLIGRSVEGHLRELVISRGRSGYLALYRYDEAADQVTVMAVRHQREAGFNAR